MTRRVGRPVRADNDRQQVLTFYPKSLRQAIKIKAALDNASMSDYLNKHLSLWCNKEDKDSTVMHRTHPRKMVDEAWVSVQIVLKRDTFMKLKEISEYRDISLASLIYSISREL